MSRKGKSPGNEVGGEGERAAHFFEGIAMSVNQLQKVMNKCNHDVIFFGKYSFPVTSLDKSDYVRLLRESSINDDTKFRPVSAERPKI